MKMTLTVGLPASKKTSWALSNRQPKDIIVCRDDIRHSNYGVWFGDPIDENHVTKIQRQQIISAFEHGHDVIVCDTNLNKHNVQKLVDLASQFKAEVEFKYFEVPIETCIAYDEHREKRVGRKVIERMARKAGINSSGKIPKQNYYYHKIEPYKNDEDKFDAIVVDIDGTIALKSDRSPYDYSRVFEDSVQWNVATMLYYAKMYANKSEGMPEIIFLSGRSADCREQTEEWLDKKFDMAGHKLFMRPSEDPNTADFIVKDRLFDKYVADQYNVIGIFDDRRQVVQCWRSKGLTVFDVAGNKF